MESVGPARFACDDYVRAVGEDGSVHRGCIVERQLDKASDVDEYLIAFDDGSDAVVDDFHLVPDLGDAEWPDELYLSDKTETNRVKLEIEDLRNALGHLGDLYSKDIHLVYELIQNADDARASLLELSVDDTGLQVVNNGRAFSKHDIDSICRVPAHSGKPGQQIGRFGIGFRSVYAITDQPRIQSGHLYFEIIDRFVPQLLPNTTASFAPYTTVYLPFRSSLDDRSTYLDHVAFLDDLTHLNPRTLLFLPNVRQLYVTGIKEPLSLHKAVEPDPKTGAELVRLYRNGDLYERWLVFSYPAVADGLAFHVAVQLDEHDDVVPVDVSVVFVFLPTEQETGLPFLIQSRFETPRTRERIKDNARNQATLRAVGQAVPRVIERLKHTGKEPRHALSLMPTVAQGSEDLFKIVVSEAQAVGRLSSIVPTNLDHWVEPVQAVALNRPDEALRSLLTAGDLERIFNESRNFVYLPAALRGNMNRILTELGVSRLDVKQFLSYVATSHILADKDAAWLCDLYAYLWERHEQLDKADVARIPLVRCDNGSFWGANVNTPPALIMDTALADEIYDLLGQSPLLLDRECATAVAARNRSDDSAPRRFLQWFGVTIPSIRTIIDDWLLPDFATDTDNMSEYDHIRLRQCTYFIMRHADEYAASSISDKKASGIEDAYQSLGEKLRLRYRVIGQEMDWFQYALPIELFLAPQYAPEAEQGALTSSVTGVQIVDPCYLEIEPRAKWQQFFTRLGVEKADHAYKIIDRVIVPRYANGKYADVSHEQLFADLDFVRRHIRAYQQAKEAEKPAWQRIGYSAARELGQSLRLRTKQDTYVWPYELYFPNAMRRPIDLEALFAVLGPGRILHPQYVTRTLTPQSGEPSWIDFMISLGVYDRPKVLRKQQGGYDSTQHPEDDSRLRAGILKIYSRWYPPHQVKTEFYSPDLSKVLDALSAVTAIKELDLVTATALYQALSRYWKDYSQQCTATYMLYPHQWGRGEREVPVPSLFAWMLQRTRWLPASDNCLHVPSEVYLDSPNLRELVPIYTPLLTIEPGPPELYQFLGVRDKPNLDTVLAMLLELSREGDVSDARILSAYRFLQSTVAGAPQKISTVQEAFRANALVALPSGRQHWWSPSQLFWEDHHRIFGDSRGYLALCYPHELRGFFADVVGVEMAPTSISYVNFLYELSRLGDVERAQSVVGPIYRLLSRQIEEGAFDLERDQVCELPIIYCGLNGFLSPDNDVYLNDDPMVREIKDNLHLVSLPQDMPLRAAAPFLEWAGCRRVSQVLSRNLVATAGNRLDPTLTDRVRRIVPLVARWLFSHSPDDYFRLQHRFAALALVEVVTVDVLDVEFAVGSHVVQSAISTFLQVDSKPTILYHRQDDTDEWSSLADELKVALGSPPGLVEFILLALTHPEVGEKSLNHHEDPLLPADAPL